MKYVNIYTDGACSGNQNDENKGGWGAILSFAGTEKELFGGEDNTTNNRMELTALIKAFEALKEDGLGLNIYSDSSYLINCFQKKWYEKWEKNGWINSKKEPVENQDLWEKILANVRKHSCNFFLVKGHVNLEKPAEVKKAYTSFTSHNGPIEKDAFSVILEYNNRCDELATRFQRGIT